MSQPFRIIGRAAGLWWREVIFLALLNIVWLILQILIVTGPPATAMMYAMARKIAAGETFDNQDALNELRRLFLPAWKWGLVNLIVGGVLLFNFSFYQNANDLIWIVLRSLWAALGFVWLAINLFYWPFYLSQTDTNVLVTFRNSALFVLKSPLRLTLLTLFCIALSVVSVLLTLPFAAALMAWLALIGTAAVEQELEI